MATTNLHMGYVGHCKIGDTGYFITGSSLNPVQTVEAPDVIAGHEMRRAWNYGKVEIGGNVTGPIHENASSLWTDAFDRTDDKDHLDNSVAVEIAYYKGNGRKFNKCYINSLQVSCTAGDVSQFTVDFIGMKDGEGDAISTISESYTPECAKLITWDRCSVSVADVTFNDAQAFTFTLNNNLQRLYSIKTDASTNNLFPVDAPAGPREITGNISLYASMALEGGDFSIGDFGANNWDDYEADQQKTVTFKIGSGDGEVMDQSFKCQFHRPEAAATTGPTIYTLNFTAVCNASV